MTIAAPHADAQYAGMKLSHIRDRRFSVTAFCDACNYSHKLDIDALAQGFGWDFVIMHNSDWFLRHLKCTRCGHRRGSLSYSPPTGYDTTDFASYGKPVTGPDKPKG